MSARSEHPAGRDASVRARDLLDRGGWQAVEQAASLFLEGEVPGAVPRAEATAFHHEVLRWAVRRDPIATLQWHAIRRQTRKPILRDRDGYVEAAWAAVRTHPAHRELRAFIDDRWGAREVYEDALAGWALGRFDVGGAVRIAAPGRRARVVVYAVQAVAVALVVSTLAWRGIDLAAGLVAVLATAVVLLAGGALSGLRFQTYLQALVPRLGAGVAIGYLFLGAAPELVAFTLTWGRPAWMQWTAAGAAVLAVWGYLILHIAQRVEPTPGAWTLARRAGDLVALGVLYTAAGLALAAPLLTSPRFLFFAGLTQPVVPRPASLALLAAVALALGVALQLAWEEKPLTDPL